MKVAIALCLALCLHAHAAILPLGQQLVRVPSADSAVIKSDRLGGNFAYSTMESHAYAAVNPVIQHVQTPVAVSYAAQPYFYTHHQPAVAYVEQPAVAYVQQPLVADEPIKPIAVAQEPVKPIEIISHPSHFIADQPLIISHPILTHPVHAVPLPGLVPQNTTPAAVPEPTTEAEKPVTEQTPAVEAAASETTPEVSADDSVAIDAA